MEQNTRNGFLLKLVILVLLVFVSGTEAKRMCSQTRIIRKFLCNEDQFTCLNGKCIARSYFCDNGNDCGDNSDEQYCGRNHREECPVTFTRCENSNKCIPNEWLCDGRNDCPSGDDEITCGRILSDQTMRLPAIQKAVNWIYDLSFNKSTLLKMDSFIHKAAVVLFLHKTSSGDATYFQMEIAKDISIQFLSRLYQKNLSDIPSTDLAAFINAMLVTCVNPRKFNGMDLINELRVRVDNQNYTNPYVFLTLCNAGETITGMDTQKLIQTFRYNLKDFWTDMKAMVVMALSCAAKQPNSNVNEEILKEFTDELKSRQFRNGSVEDVQTTALVLQAIFSTEPEEDPDNFDETKAVEYILRNQEPDGSFGNFMKTYYVLPVLNCMSLVNITSDHCQFTQTDETSALKKLENLVGPKIRVQYSLWFGNQKYLERTLALRVPVNMSLYGIMEIAAEVDDRYKFEYKMKNRKPYVNGINNVSDDPETGNFWFLYIIQNGEPSPISKSPADVIPKENDHLVMWYRSGSWIE